MVAATPLMAQSGSLLVQLGPVLLTLIGLVLAGAVLIWWVRRRMRDNSGMADAHSLENLRHLHRSGQLSDAEYQRARASLLGQLDWADRESDNQPNVGDQGHESGN